MLCQPGVIVRFRFKGPPDRRHEGMRVHTLHKGVCLFSTKAYHKFVCEILKQGMDKVHIALFDHLFAIIAIKTSYPAICNFFEAFWTSNIRYLVKWCY